MRSSDQPTNTQGDGSSRVGIAFDVVAYRVVDGSGHLPYRVDRVLGRVHGVAIQVLKAPFRLPHLPLDPRLCIAGRATKAFFHFSSEILGGATYAIFVHGDDSGGGLMERQPSKGALVPRMEPIARLGVVASQSYG